MDPLKRSFYGREKHRLQYNHRAIRNLQSDIKEIPYISFKSFLASSLPLSVVSTSDHMALALVLSPSAE